MSLFGTSFAASASAVTSFASSSGFGFRPVLDATESAHATGFASGSDEFISSIVSRNAANAPAGAPAKVRKLAAGDIAKTRCVEKYNKQLRRCKSSLRKLTVEQDDLAAEIETVKLQIQMLEDNLEKIKG